jgi:hypothetical protein
VQRTTKYLPKIGPVEDFSLEEEIHMLVSRARLAAFGVLLFPQTRVRTKQ